MTNEELTAIYNEANGLDPKRHNPITTERIFVAMMAAMEAEREACAMICEDSAEVVGATDLSGVLLACADFIRKRSNVEHNRRPQGVRVDGPVGPRSE